VALSPLVDIFDVVCHMLALRSLFRSSKTYQSLSRNG
jgi:hypothetical protein